jgi:hypothetical protein
MHDHEIIQRPEIERRKFLQLAGTAGTVGLFSSLFENIGNASPTIVKLPGFSAFAKSVKVFKTEKYYLVESSGIPAHQMMVGIKSWQQQVPTIQPYSGTNAWSIPITPVIAVNPMSARDHFLRGAIAIAVNGVPIFNALNNRGDDALLAGELDNWGGHCGRADDYHYHVAPTHLQSIVGTKVPIAYALDGFPIFGEKEIDGKKVIGLDSFNGHFDAKKKYHYHATKTYPYINGGFKGIVSEIEGQVDPQAATKAFRPSGEPLRGAEITGFDRISTDTFNLTYSLNGAEGRVKYKATLNQVSMEFTDTNGQIHSEVYTRK